MAYTAGFSVSVGDPTKASDVSVLAANDDFLKTAIDKIMVDSATPTFALVDGVTATTQSSGNNSTKLATTAYADAATISFANDANNRVVTGTGSGLNGEADLNFASNKLTVFGTTGTGAATASVLNLSTRETTVVDADQLGRIEFQAPAETGADAVLVAASIYAEADVTFDATNNATDLVLATAHDGAAAERLRITSQGEIGLAGANYGTDGQVMTSAGAGAAVAWETIPPGTTLSGTTDGTIATVTGANALEGEANLTFDGSTLAVTGDQYIANGKGLVVGHTAPITIAGQVPELQVLGTGIGDTRTGLVKFSASASSGQFHFSKSRGASIGTYTAVANNDPLGEIIFSAADGTDLANVACGITGFSGKAAGSNDVSGYLAFNTEAGGNTGNAERMRLSSVGTLMVGLTSGYSSDVGSMLFGTGQIYGTVDGAIPLSLNRLSSTGTIANFKYANTIVGSISVAASSTAYNTSSDYRLKENVIDLTGATTRVAQLQPHRFNFIADPDTTVDGFIAHEVSDIVPEAITGTKDGMQDVENVVVDADGGIVGRDQTEADWLAGKEPTLVSEATEDEVAVYDAPRYAADTVWHSTLTVPEYQGIDQAKLVPLLTAAIQELTARVAALESA